MATITARSQDEILARIELRKESDPLGFERGDYIDFLDFDHAKPYLKEGTTAEEWDEETKDHDAPLDAMRNYMPFAFGKAHGERGISAHRSLYHMTAWAWLSGDDELTDMIVREHNGNYHSYGLEILRKICEHCGWNAKELGDC